MKPEESAESHQTFLFQVCTQYGLGMRLDEGRHECRLASFLGRSRLQFLIACNIKTEGKAWEKESCASRQVDVRVDVRGAVPDEEFRGPCNILSKNLRL